jgi:hypothetical protein
VIISSDNLPTNIARQSSALWTAHFIALATPVSSQYKTGGNIVTYAIFFDES